MVENKKGIFISTVTQSFGRIIGLVFALLSVKLITNYLGTEGTGEYNTVTTFVNFFIVIADLGLFSVTVREISKNPGNEKKIISNVFFIRLISAALACVLAGIIVFLTNYNDHIKIGTLIAAGFLFFNLVSSVYDIVLQYRLKMQYSAIAELLAKFISLIALYLIITNRGSFFAVISTVAISGFAMFVFKWLFTKKFLSFSTSYDRKVADWIIRAALPLGAVFIINNIFFKIDTLILFAIKGAAAVGIYSVAYKVLEVTVFVGSYFASSLKPALAQNIENDKKAVIGVINKAFSIMLLVSLPITIVCAIFAREIIIFLSNTDFISGTSALVLLSFTLPLLYLDILLGEVLIAKDTRKLLINIAIFVLSFNIILNLILIPIFSFNGAAFVTLLSELILFVINFYYTKKIIGFHVDWNSILKILGVALVVAIGGVIIKQLDFNFLILIAMTLVLYGVLALITRIISLSSLKELINEK